MLSDSEAKAAVAAGRVPPNISLAYLEEDRDTPSMNASIFMFALTLVIVNGRAFSRLYLRKVFGVDDFLAMISMAMFIAFVPLCIVLINIGSGRHFEFIQFVMTQDILDQTEILDFTAHLVYTTLWPYAWQTQFVGYKCLPWGFVYGTNSAVSLLSDFVLFGIPIAMLRMLDMTRKRKVQLACILLPGILVVAISVARLVLVINGQWQPDQSWIYSPLLAIEVSEIGATLIALSIPGVRPLVNEIFGKMVSVLSRWFPRVFGRRRRTGVDPDLWCKTPPWQSLATQKKTRFKTSIIKKGDDDLELKGLRSPEKALASPLDQNREKSRPHSTNLWMFESPPSSPTSYSKEKPRPESTNLWMFEK
ncbi:hypothetical protein CSUB01_12185 [Colletotrichum sublineola]|uniref:Rhodopsin domain-containing protein n=1 Tax=Colletotrichum sublineola TaxID=1173701 RepID=A0A066X2P8_COLSU|nr:hypothetical protein CSUB01_12185 [Colletotrichum sublineola]